MGQSTIHFLAFVVITLLNVFFWKRKTGFGIVTNNCVGCRILVKKEQEYGITTPFKTLYRKHGSGNLHFFCKLEACEASPHRLQSVSRFKKCPLTLESDLGYGMRA